MCGIVGMYSYSGEPVRADLLMKMRDTMSHRGPDGAGIWIAPDGRTGLAHRRLAIIDLSESANQPMSNEDGTVWIVYNGEIYNHSEIRTELQMNGHRFKTDHSDTEVIVHAFEQWGKDCVHKFRGMFAFAIWDERKQEVFLFRDRIGIKPLYYVFKNGKLIFASEIKAILADPAISAELNEEAFYHYLSFLTTPAPNTLFRGIVKLPPGSYARVKRNGHAEVERYWDVLDYAEPYTDVSEQEIAARILEELRTAVRYRKVSDVPVGVFLSGGIDSSTNAALFSQGEADGVKTFSIGYLGEYQSYQNEFQYARLMAELVGAEHHERRLVVDDFINFLPELVYHQDEPIADPVCVPVYYVSKLARDNGVIVCQVGEGSDELFFGYSNWRKSLRLQKLSDLPLAGAFKELGLGLLRIANKKQTHYYEWLRRGACGEPVFWGGAEAFTEEEKKSLLSSRLKKRFCNYSSYEVLKPIFNRFHERAWERSWINWMTYLDLNLRLPELLLMRVDKMSMATSLEARVPFLDHKFVEFVMSIPGSIKTTNGELKYILKKAVHGLIPDELINRRKQGFGVPIYEWFFDKLGDYTHKKLLDFAKRTDFFDRLHIENLLKTNKGWKLWYLLNFLLWYERWIEEKGTNGER
jgi:asparagine synthase (glutamine-hydrolysing)